MNAREPFFELERLLIKAKTRGSLEDYSKCMQLYNDKLIANGVQMCEHGLTDYIVRSRMTPRIITTLAHIDPYSISDSIEEKDFEELKSYVEDLFKVNLKSVKMMRARPLGSEEGSASPCGKYNHVIFIPPAGQGFVSRDLVVHELGHAAEFTIRRQNVGLEFLGENVIFSEVVAYFAQFTYLLNFGDSNRRNAALGPFKFAYFSIMVSLAVNHFKCDWKDVVAHDVISEFQHEFTRQDLLKYIDMVRDMLASGSFTEKIVPKYSIPMAIHLLSYGDKVRSLAVHDIRTSVVENLKNIMPEQYQSILDFTDIECIFKNFIAGAVAAN